MIRAKVQDPEATTASTFRDVLTQIRELSASIAVTIKPFIDDLQQTIQDTLAENYYTRSQDDDLLSDKSNVGHTHNQSDISGTWTKSVDSNSVSATTVSGGDANFTGTGTFNNAVTSPGVYNLQLSSSYKVMYVDSGGRFGFAPSARRFKTHILDANLDPAKISQVRVKHYAYKAEVVERDRRAALPEDDPEYAADYPVQTMLGVIAEDLIGLGLTDFVFYEDDGVTPLGVRYELLALAAIPYAQSLEARIAALEKSAGITT